MKESNVRNELHHALMWRAWAPYHPTDGRKCPHCFRVIVPTAAGRADTTAKHYVLGLEAYIEVKDCKETAFEFVEISPKQRTFLSKHEESYICIGKIEPYGTRETIHSIYVIPWKKWLAAEQDIELLLGDKSMPYDYSLYTNNVAPRGSDLVTRFPQYKLERRDGSWHFPENHPLAVMPEITTPFFMRNKEKNNAYETATPVS